MCVKSKQRVTINYSVNLALRACIVFTIGVNLSINILTDVALIILLIADVTLFRLGQRISDFTKKSGLDNETAAFTR